MSSMTHLDQLEAEASSHVEQRMILKRNAAGVKGSPWVIEEREILTTGHHFQPLIADTYLQTHT
ncbi:hypothetical protein IP70_13325 [alpha proteobacterium AAP38]|nr:hypothetical protein IP70_13325 [alpha proteobacterium AAP38]